MTSDIATAEGSNRSDETPPSSIFTSHEDEPFLSTSRLPTSKPSYLPWQASSTRSIIAVLFAIVFVIAFGAALMVVPLTRIYENIICHYYYNDLEGDGHIGFDEEIPEEMCKGEQVQERMNMLLAVLGTLSCIPGNYLAVGMSRIQIGQC